MSEQNKSDYHVLGGWLKFIVVMAYLSAGLLATSGITAIVALINAVRVVSAYSSYPTKRFCSRECRTEAERRCREDRQQ